MVGLLYESFLFFSKNLVMAKHKQIGTTAHAIDTAAKVIADTDPGTATSDEFDEIGSPYKA